MTAAPKLKLTVTLDCDVVASVRRLAALDHVSFSAWLNEHVRQAARKRRVDEYVARQQMNADPDWMAEADAASLVGVPTWDGVE